MPSTSTFRLRDGALATITVTCAIEGDTGAAGDVATRAQNLENAAGGLLAGGLQQRFGLEFVEARPAGVEPRANTIQPAVAGPAGHVPPGR